MSSRFFSTLFFFFLLFPGKAVLAATIKEDAQPFVPLENEFATAIVMVPGTHQVLYAFKPYKQWPAASLTKIPNALVWTRRSSLPYGKMVALKKQDEVGGGRLRLPVGATMTFRDLWYSSIVASANNAAMALARSYGLGIKGFVKQMNAEVKRIGAKHSVFVDPSGMDPMNRTTAFDMALIAEAAFRKTEIRLASVVGSYQFRARSGTASIRKSISNTNKLLTQDEDVYVLGGKTGYLEESLYNYMVRLRPMDGDAREELVIVVFGAPTKDGSFASAKRLAEWSWNNHVF